MMAPYHYGVRWCDMTMKMKKKQAAIPIISSGSGGGGGSSSGSELAASATESSSSHDENRRRHVLKMTTAATTIMCMNTLFPTMANAGIDPNVLKTLPVEGDASGMATRLRQIEAKNNVNNNPITDLENIPYEELPSGVLYREYRAGQQGDAAAVVQPGSKVAVEMSIRCKSFRTAKEPGGLKYFATKEDTDFNELAFTVGTGAILPGLEEGMMGMHKGALRRIEIPSTMVFAAKKANQLPLPTTNDGKRRFENLFKTDATLLIEVLVTRIKY